jgi:uncharacterized protein with PIN domain
MEKLCENCNREFEAGEPEVVYSKIHRKEFTKEVKICPNCQADLGIEEECEEEDF